MDIRQISYILAISETGNMTKAAQKLHVSQSALSQTYKAVERELGLTLFQREGRNLRLTEDGRYFCEKGEPLLRMMNLFLQEMNDRKKHISNTIRYYTDVVDNCDETMIQYQHFFPEIEFHRFYGQTTDAIKAILNNNINLSLTLRLIEHPDLISEKLIDEPVVALLPPGHPLTDQDFLYIRELDGEILTIYQNAGSLKELFYEFFRLGGARVSKVMEVYDPFIQIQNHMGFIFMPESTYINFKRRHMLGNLSGIRVADEFCRRRVFLTYKKEMKRNPLLKGYFHYLKCYHKISQEEACLPDLDRFYVKENYHLEAFEG